VGRRLWLVALVGVIVVLQVITVWPRITEDPLANHTASEVFARVKAHGGIPCISDNFTGLRMVGYTQSFGVATSRAQLEHCTVVVALRANPSSQPAKDAEATFKHRTVLPARIPGVLWSQVPTRCWLRDPAPSSCPSGDG
jgi:hypothetical protein